ncbi:MAG: hypothetical protein GY765_41860, partial [bacterium]|nr:hypothetical protein [bacterium]
MYKTIIQIVLLVVAMLLPASGLLGQDTITVNAPVGAEAWEVNSQQEITWTSTGTITDVKLWYSADNGDNWTTISASTPNDGSFTWTVPDNPSPSCLMRIGDADEEPIAVSPSAFRIIQSPSVTFTRITDGPFGTDKGNSNGCAWGDYNGDSRPDLFVCNDTGSSNFLYTNNGDGTFTKVTEGIIVNEDAGIVSIAACWGDYDNDGDLDLFVANFNTGTTPYNFLYRNLGDGSFEKITSGNMVSESGQSISPSWVDYDNDGLLDLFVGDRDDKDALYKNIGGGEFQKITDSAIVADIAVSYCNYWTDLDNDGDKDLYSARPQLYTNNGNGTFNKIFSSDILHHIYNSNTVSAADFNNDGLIDLFIGVTDGPNFLYQNNGDGTYLKILNNALVTDNFDSRASAWGDYDNDGDLDIFVSYRGGNNYLYRNEGGGYFTSITTGAPVSGGGASTGCAWADYDGDGDLDLFVANTSGESNMLLRNDGNYGNHRLRVRCIGPDTSGIGTRITARAVINGKNVTQTREVSCVSGLHSQTDSVAFFGMGNASVVDQVTVTWPTGQTATYNSVAVDSFLEASIHSTTPPSTTTVTAPKGGEAWVAGQIYPITWTASGATVKIEYSTDSGLTYSTIRGTTENDGIHEWTVPDTPSFSCRIRITSIPEGIAGESEFRFAVEPAPITQFTPSTVVFPTDSKGMGFAWSDYDFDGYPDLFICDYYGGVNRLYRNDRDGALVLTQMETLCLDGTSSFNTGARWIDYDKDGRLDVFLSLNGQKSNALYRWDDDAETPFVKLSSASVVTDTGNTYTALCFDYDNDGDIDILSVNRDQANVLYRNEGGTFSKITSGPLVADTSGTIGASLCDYDNDGDMDVFMANIGNQHNGLFRNDGDGTFSKITEGPVYAETFISRSGAWGDYDNDGDMDLFVCNAGENNSLFQNQGDGTFVKITDNPVINQTGGGDSRTATWIDYDNDADLDLFVVNIKSDDFLFRNHGSGNFTREKNFSFATADEDIRSLVTADYNRDGAVDVYVGIYNDTDRLYKNTGSSNKWLQVKCNGTRSNTTAVGTRVEATITIGGKTITQVREIAGQDFNVQHDPTVCFGLKSAAEVDQLKITWPSGTVQTFDNVATNQYLEIAEPVEPGPVTASIVLQAPNGGETFDAGAPVFIRWVGSNSISDVKLLYSPDNGATWVTITASTPNDGAFAWSAPYQSSSQCLIKVANVADTVSDTGNGVFSIITPDITVTTPNGSGEYDIGSTVAVTWTTTGTVGDVKIEYSPDNGTTYKTIIASTPNTEIYNWTAPDDISASCLLKVSSVTGDLSDVSSGNFAILPIMAITSPAAAVQWQAEEAQTVTWTCSGTLGQNITLEYSTDNGSTYTTIADTGNSGSYNWTLPDVFSNQCRVVIRGVGDRLLAQSAVFEIQRVGGDPFERITGSPVEDATALSFGATWGDYDNDGYPDLFVPNYGKDNDLYHNNGDGTFTEVAFPIETNKNTMTASWGDYDNDGFADIFVCNNGPQNNYLYHNNGDGTFTKMTNTSSFPMVTGGGHSYSTAWVDYDNDGFIDLFVANRSAANFLYHNDGDGTFTRITSGPLVADTSQSIGSCWSDYDNDGDMDVYLANIGNQHNDLYRNDGGGTFTRISSGAMGNDGTSCYGATWGDYDNDGLPDLYVTTNAANFLYHNDGGGAFTKITGVHPVTDSAQSRGSLWGDFDNDGDLDLYVANDKSNNCLYWNEGSGQFNKMATGASVSDSGRAFAVTSADYDRDGHLDIVIANYGAARYLYHNKGNSNNWVQIKPVGDASNRLSIGAKIRVTATINGQTVQQVRVISGQSGYLSQDNTVAHFGMGNASTIDEIRVEWPSGTIRTFNNQDVNQIISPNESEEPSIITLDAPNGGETLTVGQTVGITWVTSANVGPVSIQYSKNGSDYVDIITTTDNDASYDWLVPIEAVGLTTTIKIREVGGDVSDVSDAVFTVIAPVANTITVTAPNGGENWEVGSNQTIGWISSGSIANVKIDLSTDNGGSWDGIAASTPNNGSFSWTVTDTPSTACLIRITDTASSTTDNSDTAFTITRPGLTLTSPNGGENWETGTTETISWTSIGTIANVKIELYRNSAWEQLSASTANTGSYSWAISEPASTNCKVRISDAAKATTLDESDTVFTLTKPGLTLTSPNGGEDWETGTTKTISWTSIGTIANVKIELFRNGAWELLNASVTNTDSYSWAVSEPASTNCKVRISDAAKATTFDESDAVFTITKPGITVTTPNGGEDWETGNNQTINWTSTGTITNVKIELFRNSVWEVLSASEANSGSYGFMLEGEASTSCKVRISDVAKPATTDESDAVFSTTKPGITILSPNGNEDWEVGTGKTITWNSVGTIANVKIELFRNGVWEELKSSEANDGSMDWTVTGNGATDCKVRISDAANTEVTDESDAVFTITKPSITVTSPNGNDDWEVGTTKTITWSSVGTIANVKIELFRNGAWEELKSSETNDGSMDWTVTGNGATDCKVRISDAANTEVTDESDAVFTITKPSIT